MIQKRFELIDKSDIDALVADTVTEGKTIDYKEALPGNSDGDKKEFLKDISSFANASGGDIIYGIQEKRDDLGKATGLPETAKGLAGVNVDQETLRLDNIMRSGIAPRIGGVQIKGIDGFPNGPVMVIRIPKSWAAPHMLVYQSESRFFSRTNAGKYPLDVTELRSAFAFSETLSEKVRRFREERLARIVADETPLAMEPSPKIILHVLPISALEPGAQIDLGFVAQQLARLRPIRSDGWNHRYNFDGFLTYEPSAQSSLGRSYLQVFRHGAIEAVAGHMTIGEGKNLIPSIAFEQELISAVDQYLALEKDLGVYPPLFVMLSLLGIKGYTIATRRALWPGETHPIDRDALLLPEILVEDYGVNPGQILRPAFDTIWQAAGWHGSLNYDPNGKWIGQR